MGSNRNLMVPREHPMGKDGWHVAGFMVCQRAKIVRSQRDGEDCKCGDKTEMGETGQIK